VAQTVIPQAGASVEVPQQAAVEMIRFDSLVPKDQLFRKMTAVIDPRSNALLSDTAASRARTDITLFKRETVTDIQTLGMQDQNDARGAASGESSGSKRPRQRGSKPIPWLKLASDWIMLAERPRRRSGVRRQWFVRPLATLLMRGLMQSILLRNPRGSVVEEHKRAEDRPRVPL
jgi:hypothetical protein